LVEAATRCTVSRHVIFNQLLSAAVFVPAAEPAATTNELQQLMDDALVAEGVDYVRSDNSLSLTEDNMMMQSLKLASLPVISAQQILNPAYTYAPIDDLT
jgi:hypothetical protein